MALSLLGKRKNTSIRGGRKWSGHRGRFIYCASYARGKALVGLVWISLRLSGGGGHGVPFRAKRRSGRCSDRGSGRSGTYRPYLWGRFALLLVRRVEKGGAFWEDAGDAVCRSFLLEGLAASGLSGFLSGWGSKRLFVRARFRGCGIRPRRDEDPSDGPSTSFHLTSRRRRSNGTGVWNRIPA
jgi:hypothetical protein